MENEASLEQLRAIYNFIEVLETEEKHSAVEGYTIDIDRPLW